MSKRRAKPGGAVGPLMVVCGAGALAGLALDFMQPAQPAFWIGAAPGGAAALGAAAAVFAVIGARLVAMVLGRGKDGSDADA
ncbi:MAG: hypothetical protein JNM59_11490 [Hyphomonadaceae bacterium]|nr:hypothetical protein [Hyphomonadaceae bacterium]